MKMEDDIFKLAQRRRATRNSSQPDIFKDNSNRKKNFPSERILRIDNFTSGPEVLSPVPSPIPPLSPQIHRRLEPAEFLSDVAGRDRNRKTAPLNTNSFFKDDIPYSRNILPPLIPVIITGEEIVSLVNTSSHISLISTRLVSHLGLRKDFISDTNVPPSPLTVGGSSNTPYLVEGKLRYVEIAIKGSKHVTQLYVARELPAELILGVDLLKKAQVKINFQDGSFSLPSGPGQKETKVSFLSSKELNQQLFQQAPPGMIPDFGNTRAYSSNF